MEDSLAYHQLITGFLQELCARTAGPVYCLTAQHFASYLRTAPALRGPDRSGPASPPDADPLCALEVFAVGIVVTQGSRTVLWTSANRPHGVDSFSLPGLSRPGQYVIRLAATDLAENFARIVGALQVSGR